MKWVVPLLLVLPMVLLVACSPESAPTQVGDGENSTQTAPDWSQGGGSDAQEETTLTVWSLWDEYGISAWSQQYQELNPNVKIVHEAFTGDVQASYLRLLETKLMGGSAPDIFYVDRADYYAYANSGLLADFYELMDSDATFDRDDYFTNLFEAFEFKGGLYAFPLGFTFLMPGVNINISDELVESYTKLDAVRYRDLIDMHQRFNTDGRYRLDPNFTPSRVFFAEFNQYIDFENGTSDFSNKKLVDLLDDSLRSTAPNRDWSTFIFGTWSRLRLSREPETTELNMFLLPAVPHQPDYLKPGSLIFVTVLTTKS